jgi:hypothetical protein
MLPFHFIDVDQAQIYFVHQVDALKRVSRTFVLQEVPGHPEQFLINARSQLFQGLGVAPGPRPEKPRSLGVG